MTDEEKHRNSDETKAQRKSMRFTKASPEEGEAVSSAGVDAGAGRRAVIMNGTKRVAAMLHASRACRALTPGRPRSNQHDLLHSATRTLPYRILQLSPRPILTSSRICAKHQYIRLHGIYTVVVKCANN